MLVDKGVSDTPSSGRMTRYTNSPGMTSFASSSEFDLQPGTNGSALDVSIDLVRADDILKDLGLDYISSNDEHHGITTAATTKKSGNVCYKLLKIDVEGYELKALHGLWGNATNTATESDTTTIDPPPYPFETIVMEYFPSMLKSAGVSDPMEVLRYIAQWGYTFYIIEGNEGTLVKIIDLEKDERLQDVHGSGYHINLLAKRVIAGVV